MCLFVGFNGWFFVWWFVGCTTDGFLFCLLLKGYSCCFMWLFMIVGDVGFVVWLEFCLFVGLFDVVFG